MSTHGKPHEELAGALGVVLVQEVVQGLVESLAVHQYQSAPPRHAGLDRLNVHADLVRSDATKNEPDARTKAS